MQSTPASVSTSAPTPQEKTAEALIEQDRPGTPPCPPYSPLTPVFAHLDPVAAGEATIIPPPLSPSPTTRTLPHLTSAYQPPPPPTVPPVFKPPPPPVSISESENPDAIALRSAISILQLQKQQSLRDIKSLERMKEAAATDPEGFARDLAAGRLKTEDRGTVIQFSDDGPMDTDEEDEKEGAKPADEMTSTSAFGHIPPPQNVVRMPPINWAKYQVIGEPLDRMHQEQLRLPHPGQPAQEYMLASPYRPLVDQLETPTRLGRPSKTKKT
ncbi:uncharacterized protein N7459_002356 [Penicillium hispanicum]|uniref:uncharacterized protein n=1 Tax=Penicillium hispanicum TaxID=1080232 RepID=UPI0025403ADE|nr:uncharacterized protein N7459_002356 [Penicillium hispanicum]KAJ5591987.1 hypothetical protein N7459_002356 [Penicillium hispanicum]